MIKNGTFLTMDSDRPVIESGFIGITGGSITELGKMSRLRKGTAKMTIDAKGKLVTPGLISGHTHSGLTFLRGLADDLTLDQMVETRLWPYEGSLKPEESYWSARLSCLEMMKAGVTCFADMHFNMLSVAEAVRDSGIRASLSVALMDVEDSPVNAEESLKENTELVERYHNSESGRITCMFGPCTVRIASVRLFVESRELADRYGVGLHIHLSETKDDVRYTLAKHRMRPVEYLAKNRVLGGDVLAAHCVHLTDAEIGLLKKHDVKVVHNPSSNVKTSAGIARVSDMLVRGIIVGIGVDAAVCNNALDVFQDMKLAALLQAVAGKNRRCIPAKTVVQMATLHNARALGLGDKIGSLKVGKRADIVMLDLQQPHFAPLTNYSEETLCSRLVYSTSGRDVETVIVDGKLLVHRKKVLNQNEEETVRVSRKIALRVLKRSGILG